MADARNHEIDTTPKPRFGRLLLACALAVLFCGWLVWFASTYMRDCCAP